MWKTTLLLLLVSIAASLASHLPLCTSMGFLAADVVNRRTELHGVATYTVVKNIIYPQFQGLNDRQLQNESDALGLHVDVRASFEEVFSGKPTIQTVWFDPIHMTLVCETESVQLCNWGFDYAYVILLHSEPIPPPSIIPPLSIARAREMPSLLSGPIRQNAACGFDGRCSACDGGKAF